MPLSGAPFRVTVIGPSVPDRLTVALPFVVVVFGFPPFATMETYSVAVVLALLPVLFPLIVWETAGGSPARLMFQLANVPEPL